MRSTSTCNTLYPRMAPTLVKWHRSDKTSSHVASNAASCEVASSCYTTGSCCRRTPVNICSVISWSVWLQNVDKVQRSPPLSLCSTCRWPRPCPPPARSRPPPGGTGRWGSPLRTRGSHRFPRCWVSRPQEEGGCWRPGSPSGSTPRCGQSPPGGAEQACLVSFIIHMKLKNDHRMLCFDRIKMHVRLRSLFSSFLPCSCTECRPVATMCLLHINAWMESLNRLYRHGNPCCKAALQTVPKSCSWWQYNKRSLPSPGSEARCW